MGFVLIGAFVTEIVWVKGSVELVQGTVRFGLVWCVELVHDSVIKAVSANSKQMLVQVHHLLAVLPLSCKLETHKPVKSRFWPCLEPIFSAKDFKTNRVVPFLLGGGIDPRKCTCWRS